MMIKYSKGFTLLELIIAIGIVGILASMAMPAFDTQLKNSRLVSNTNLIIGAFNLARSEAINKGLRVKVTGTTSGWAVVEDVSAIELNRFEPDSNGITITIAPLASEVVYTASGFRPFDDNATVTVEICDERNIGRLVTISSAGSTKVEGVDPC